MAAFAGEPLTVAQNETLVVNAGTNVSAVTVHGRLDVTAGYFEVANGSNSVFIDLGPDVGDEGEMVVTNATIKSSTGANNKINVRIGNNGGGDKAKLRIYKTTYNYSYLGPFTLSADATTSGERFESLEIGEGGYYLLSSVVNANAKPLVISFTGEGGKLGKFWSGSLFSLTGGGDIVLKSVNGSTITLGGYRTGGAVADFFAADRNGMLRTEGDGDVVIDLDGGNGAGAVYCLNAANVAWGHAGRLFLGTETVTRYGIIKVTVDNALPYGAAMKETVVRTRLNSSANVLDVCGTTQRLNGLAVTNGSVVTNSSPEEAVLVFGTGDTDGRISGVNITNSAIRCVKTGSGTLTLEGVALNTLSGDGGTIHIASKTYIGTLALTNVFISFANGDTSLLTVDRNQLDPSVTLALPDGEATNCVFMTCPALFGATAVKAGGGFVTYATPDDARGMALEVRNGVLRFGGAPCSNEFWRIILKKANGGGRTYTFADGSTKFISVGIGTFAIFNEAGINANGAANGYKCDTGDDPDNAPDLAGGEVTTKRPSLEWSTTIYQSSYPAAFALNSKDPILNGNLAYQNLNCLINNNNIYSNSYDVFCTSDNYKGTVFSPPSGILYDSTVLDPDNSGTWEYVTWRTKSNWPKSRISYAFRRMPGFDMESPYLTDWELQSSPTGQPGTWVTMDERANQRWWSQDEAGSSGLDPKYQYTYNNHIPYLFKSLNANWRFTTFGTVSVAAGATLDLSELREENIAFNGLKVDMAAGAGTITHFSPAANGTLYLTNMTAAQTSSSTLRLPLTVGTVLSVENLSTWSVVMNGVPTKNALLCVKNGELCVKSDRGFICVIK